LQVKGKINMKLHRFYIKELHNKFGEVSFGEIVWVHDEKVLWQWVKVLRYRVGDELVVFNDNEERLYKIEVIEDDSVKLQLITQLERKVPNKKIYLLWSVLKKDKNDWVIQKACELGVHKFIPIIAERSEKTDLNIDRAKKIIIEASEQCGRSDIPEIREPISLTEAISEYSNRAQLLICEQDSGRKVDVQNLDSVGILVGPEGGWSEPEKKLFLEQDFPHIAISNFTLRAETAAVVGVAKLMSG
jgi:16S rRNA (uracil1498-N3)-methyltransferase